MDPQGILVYPGINAVKRARYTQGHGETPDVITADIVPQDLGTISASGTAVFSFGGTTVALPNCAIDFASLSMTTSGHVERLRILDRRWAWRFGSISGQYNLRLLNGTLLNEKNPRELAAILLQQMGETFDVSMIPTDGRPHVNWVCANPADELSKLADLVGCRIVLGYGNDPVRIWPLGIGPGAPENDDIQTLNFGIDPKLAPRSVQICGDRILFQVRFKLEAVGEDIDGAFKPLKDLSYAPNPGDEHGGFSGDLESGLLNLAGQTEEQQLAKNTVFRYYRVKSFADGSLNMPAFGEIQDIRQVFPLRDTLIDMVESDDGVLTPMPAYVSGVHVKIQESVPARINSDENAIVAVPYVLLRDRGIVKFADRVHMVEQDQDGNLTGTTKPADLYFTCTCYLQRMSDRLYFRYKREKQITNNVTGPKVLKSLDLKRRVIARYSNVSQVKSIEDNVADLDAYANHLINVQTEVYKTRNSFAVLYRGLQAYPPTGTRQQVTFMVSDTSGCQSSIAVNTEIDPYVRTYEERRSRRLAIPQYQGLSNSDNDSPPPGDDN